MSPDDSHQEPDLEPIAGADEPADDDPTGDTATIGAADNDEADEAEPPSRGRNAIIAGVAVGVIAGAALFGVQTANGNKAKPTLAATSGTTPSGSTQTPGAGNGGPTGTGLRMPGTAGTISAIDGSTLTVKDPNGTTTKVKTTSATTVSKTDTAALSTIEVGDNVNVVGTGTSTAIAAQRITDSGDVAATTGPGGGGFDGGRGPGGNGLPPEGAIPQGGDGTPPNGGPGGTQTNSFVGASGTVKSISGSTLTVTSTAGTTVTVTTTSATTVAITSASSVSALAVGDQVVVTGTTTDDVVTATAIREGESGFFRGFRGSGDGTSRTGATTPTTNQTT